MHVNVTPNPWNENTQLMHVGVQGFEIDEAERPRANLVFLIDVSGSMNQPNKLPLAVQAMHMLVDELHPDDTVSIVVYAGAAGAVLEPTRARNARRIHEALDRLRAGGSTAGGAKASIMCTPINPATNNPPPIPNMVRTMRPVISLRRISTSRQ